MEDSAGWLPGGIRVAALAGGVGGAKLAVGLAAMVPPGQLTIIVNTGDDFDHLGLRVCPDIDTVCYTLAGLANPETGWGRAGETWHMMEDLVRLGGPGWFRLGDHDLATHLERSRRLTAGQPLSAITRDFCHRWGIQAAVLPMSDDPVATWVDTHSMGWLAFQEYFVREQCEPPVTGFQFRGARAASPAPGVLAALETADWVVVCPSNPWVSIGPIWAIPAIGQALRTKRLAIVSPIVGGQAIKGPAAKMYRELGITPSALAVARHYQALLAEGRPTDDEPVKNLFVIDTVDRDQAAAIEATSMAVLVTNTVMKTPKDRHRLAAEVLDACIQHSGRTSIL